MSRRIDIRILLREGRSEHEVLTLLAELARHHDVAMLSVDTSAYDRRHSSLGNAT